jgi:hypothetical protein
MFNSKTYDTLKWVALIALPASASFYAGFGQLWGLPATGEVVTTIVLVDTFLGALLQLSASKHNKNPDGYLEIVGRDDDTGLPELKMTVVKHPDKVARGKVAHLKIGSPPPPQHRQNG